MSLRPELIAEAGTARRPSSSYYAEGSKLGPSRHDHSVHDHGVHERCAECGRMFFASALKGRVCRACRVTLKQ